MTHPHDPAITAFGHLQDRVYFEPDMLIPALYIGRLLDASTRERQNVLLLAEDGGQVLGGTVFHWLAEAGCGFSSFLGVDTAVRGQGVARRLHQARWQTLLELSGGRCHAVFIDVVNPARESPEQREQELRAGSDALARRRAFHALGFRTVNLRYEQPVGGDDPEQEGGGPVTDMDLLAYVPGAPATLPATWPADTMRAYWTPWLGPARADKAATRLKAGHEEVRLLPAWEGPQMGKQD